MAVLKLNCFFHYVQCSLVVRRHRWFRTEVRVIKFLVVEILKLLFLCLAALDTEINC